MTGEAVRLADLTPAQQRLVLALVDALRESEARAPVPEQLLDVGEAAAAMSIGRSLVYAEIAAGRLRSVKVGRRRLIPASAIGEYAAG